MKKYSSKKSFGFLLVWVIAATAVGVYLVNTFNKPKGDTPAPLAQARQCGPTDIGATEEQKLTSEWFISPEKLTVEARKAVAMNMKALPNNAYQALKKYNLKISLDRGQSPYICQTFDSTGAKRTSGLSPRRSVENCLRTISKNSVALVLGRPRLEMPDGQQRFLSDKDLIDEFMTPALYWALLEGLYQPSDDQSKALGPDEPSIANISTQIRNYVVDGYKFTDAEQDYYRRRFGAAGTDTPSFVTRTLVLTASNLYCSKDSFDRLSKSQPEATQRFMSIYGCALGKPWHLADGDFSKFCSSVAVAK